ncbi:uncharacterized protein LOC133506778 isoform X2 [Syngnathoides biaculeatus]|uniref:uncharacterized protein LOC133506778 isoform X2 n=1 Tax=Syngnathoides biaculeatus TaxID=300417 RepID=UPI002ADD682A|nr:uncharacterized protein LOC133506778 isoform X2 [Syngnathoides biaculeatus]
MLQYCTDFVGETEEAHETICSTSGPKSPDVPVPCLLEEPTVSAAHPSVATKTSNSARGTKPPNTVNGYLNHVKGKATNSAPARNGGKQRTAVSAAAGALVNGEDHDDVLSAFERPSTERDPPLATGVKNKRSSHGWRRRKKSRKPRNRPDSDFEGTRCILRHTEPACPKKPGLRLPDEEDWDKECQTNLKSFSSQDYEDFFATAFEDLALGEEENGPGSACYSPAVHHPHPVPMLRSSIDTEPQQFSDADE